MKVLTHISTIRKVAAVFSICALFVPLFVHAEAPRDMEVSPAVIDEKAKQRDIIKESVTLTNTGSRLLNLFPAVEDVNTQSGDQTFAYAQNADARSDSLANWIELSRGVVELSPGETKTVPFIIHVNSNAVTGTYHAAITFTDGGTRDETANKNPDGMANVNVEVQADIKEDLQLLKFTTDKIIFNGDDVLFNYQVVNNGNQNLQPSGDIRIYNRRGEEVATVDVNKDGKSVSPEQTAQLASVWSAVSGFGQYKALITVNYGKTQTASVQDTVFFWIVPWKQLLGLFTITIIAIAALGLYFHRWFEERHLNRLAMAGLLKTHPVTAAALASATAYMPQFGAMPAPVPRPRPPPPKAQEKKEPKERIVMRVAENIVIAWRLFTTFKRSGRITPKDIAQERAATMPQVATAPKAPPETGYHETPSAQVPTQTPHREEARHGETIDLKNIRPQPKEQLNHGHVVNLKKQL
jgi:hypothetical protein